MNILEVEYETLNAYELYVLEYDAKNRASALIMQLKKRLEDNNKIILQKLEKVDEFAEQYAIQNRIARIYNDNTNVKPTNFLKKIKCLMKWSA